ncbi:hypothetical protein PILCRDRAFT_758372 [Piloderma croceum F 1598]|uniref:Uncharacterized protein n=1 Tax=Piloderma croceum (strain F 1598) TaxID=765440 RepID=A0A0C3ET23_PILCF|nr:hypothetical protein PILCRDRAFT_758372 [Piloderma croceum F 1598]
MSTTRRNTPTKQGSIPSLSTIILSTCFSSRSNLNMTSRTVKDFVNFFSKCTGLPSQQHWRFIFIKPPDIRSTLKCMFPSTDALRKLPLYSAEVDMD